jgi:uncharacterized protein
MRLDANGVEVLGCEECFALMGSAPFGRVIFTDRALPAVEPVSFALDGHDVIIATARDSKLASALRGTVVAFETDDVADGTGWSVTLVGQTSSVRSAAEIGRLSRLPMRSWPGPHEQFIRIHGEFVSGRRVHPALLEATR